MSFGSSIGDFVSVGQLVLKLRKDFASAPEQFSAISAEVRSLSIVLQDADVVCSESKLGEKQREEIRDILHGCHQVLSELEIALEKYDVLGSSGKKWEHRTKRAWKRMNWDPEDISKLRDRVVSNVTLLNAFLGRLSSGISLEIKMSVDQLNRQQADRTRLDLLNWLSTTDYSSVQSDYLGRRQNGTGQWLLDLPEYEVWMQEPGKSLFCPGMPGAGKTILASIIIDSLCTKFESDPKVGVAYVYCNYRRQNEQTVNHFMLSILKQLGEGISTLPIAISELANKHTKRRTRPSLNEILVALQTVISMYERVFIIIDALDECSVAHDLMSRIFELQMKGVLNLLVTSRDSPELAYMLKDSDTIEIRATDEDVRKYIEGYFVQFSRLVQRNSDLQTEITNKVSHAVSGMFLLAQLHMESLKGKMTPKSLRTALDHLVEGSGAYDKAYDEAMERIRCQTADQSELAMRTFAWITDAKRPLTTGELLHALAVEVGRDDLDEENLHEIEDIVSVCAGLVTIDKESNIIRLVHYTTQEYFKRTRCRWFPDAAVEITAVCVTYLSFSVFEDGPCQTDEEYEQRLQIYKLYVYAARSWAYHAAEAADKYQIPEAFFESSAQRDAAGQAFGATKRMYLNRNYSQIFTMHNTRLHLAARFGLESFARQLLGVDDPNCLNSHGQTPINLAAKNGHEPIVKLLLDLGAEVDLGDARRNTPLNWAIKHGHTSIATLLIKYGADINSASQLGETPLGCAAIHGNETVAKLLIDKGATSNLIRGDFSQFPLCRAARHGHTGIMMLLLEKSVNFDLKSSREVRHLLIGAVRNGHESTVRLLIEKGADVNFLNFLSESPLGLATSNGHESMTRLLVEKGANVDVEDSLGQTPFVHATIRACESTMRLLLANGADINTQDIDGKTPLHLAVEMGITSSTKLLLELGARLHLQDNHGNTPLHAAVEGEQEPSMRLLLENGAKIDIKDIYGQTPLSCAARRGYEVGAKLFLEMGVDFNLQNEIVQNPWIVQPVMRISLVKNFFKRPPRPFPVNHGIPSYGYQE